MFQWPPVEPSPAVADPARPEALGARFVRRAWIAIGVAAALLVLAIGGLRLASDALRAQRILRSAVVETEDRTARAVAHTADRAEVEAEVDVLLEQRASLAGRLLPADPAPVLEPRFRSACAAAELQFEGLSTLRGRQRGALRAIPGELRFAGSRHQLPILLDAFYAQREALAVTGIDLEVVNFIDDRVTGVLRFEAYALGDPPPPGGDVLRPFLPVPLPAAASHASPLNQGARRALDEATAGLEAQHEGLLAYEALTVARDHYLAEWEQVDRLEIGRAQAQADIAQALPRLLRALSRSALGRAGFRVQPGGPVEMIAYD